MNEKKNSPLELEHLKKFAKYNPESLLLFVVLKILTRKKDKTSLRFQTTHCAKIKKLCK